ncbi:hypothetical protein GJ496_008969 [Pomphorhynchus laevis]|nr:hypothetical protein GJ496_008969 [Pomphorhynchus laevis]
MQNTFDIPRLYPIKIAKLETVLSLPSLLDGCCARINSNDKLVLNRHIVAFDPKCDSIVNRFSTKTLWFPSDCIIQSVNEANDLFELLQAVDYWLLFGAIDKIDRSERGRLLSSTIVYVIFVDIRHHLIRPQLRNLFSKLLECVSCRNGKCIAQIDYSGLLSSCCDYILPGVYTKSAFVISNTLRTFLCFATNNSSFNYELDNEYPKYSNVQQNQRKINSFIDKIKSLIMRNSRHSNSTHLLVEFDHPSFQFIHFSNDIITMLALGKKKRFGNCPRPLSLIGSHAMKFNSEKFTASSSANPTIVVNDATKAYEAKLCSAFDRERIAIDKPSKDDRNFSPLSNTSALSSVASLSRENICETTLLKELDFPYLPASASIVSSNNNNGNDKFLTAHESLFANDECSQCDLQSINLILKENEYNRVTRTSSEVVIFEI